MALQLQQEKLVPRVKGGSQDKEEATLRERLIYLSALIGSRLILPASCSLSGPYSYAMSNEHRDGIQYKNAPHKLFAFHLFSRSSRRIAIISIIIGERFTVYPDIPLPPLSGKISRIVERGSWLDDRRKSTRGKEG